LSVVGEEVEDDGGELGGSSSLGEEDGVGGGDGEEGSDTGWREERERTKKGESECGSRERTREGSMREEERRRVGDRV